MDETSSSLFRDGAAGKIEFTLSLEHVDDDRTDLLGDISTSSLARLAGAYA